MIEIEEVDCNLYNMLPIASFLNKVLIIVGYAVLLVLVIISLVYFIKWIKNKSDKKKEKSKLLKKAWIFLIIAVLVFAVCNLSAFALRKSIIDKVPNLDDAYWVCADIKGS